MDCSLVRGKYVVCKVTGRNDAQVIEGGAVSAMAWSSNRSVLRAGGYRPDETIGTPEHIVPPGCVRRRHHVGLTPLQTGSPDHPLELWWASRLAQRDVDFYLDTLHPASEMIESDLAAEVADMLRAQAIPLFPRYLAHAAR